MVQVIVATTNGGQGHSTGAQVPDLPFQDGTVLRDVLDASYTTTVTGGSASINVANGQWCLCLAMRWHSLLVTGAPRVLTVVSEISYA
jgi:hypothetical protein